MMIRGSVSALFGIAGAWMVAVAPVSQASAQQPAITVLSQGENFAVEYGPGHSFNLVGGAAVRSVTGGEGGSIAYSDGRAMQSPMLTNVTGQGENQQIVYSAPVVPDVLLAGSRQPAGLVETASAADRAGR
jgi:hypothetical protein